MSMVLGRRPNQGRPTDVDVLDRLTIGDIVERHGCLKRIEVDYHQLKGFEAVTLEIFPVILLGRVGQDPTMNLGVEGLDPSSKDLRRTGDVGNSRHFNAGFLEGAGRTAR